MVIELHKQGKTIKEIARIVHKNFRDISRIIKRYERKKELQAKREESNQSNQPKKPPISTQAFKLFSDGNKLTDVAIDLEIPAKRALKLWFQFLRLERMYDCYEFYQDYQYELLQLLTISSFIKRNNIDGKDFANIFRTANDIINLNQMVSNLKTEINSLEQRRMNLSYYSHSGFRLQPLSLNKPNYNYYRY